MATRTVFASLSLAVLVLGAPAAYGETISLVCEHDGGINTSTGMPNPTDTEIFRIDFDTRKNEVTTPFFRDLGVRFDATDYSVAWRVKLPDGSQTWTYRLNRMTGTLFVTIQAGEDTYVGKGECTKPRPIL